MELTIEKKYCIVSITAGESQITNFATERAAKEEYLHLIGEVSHKDDVY